MVNGSFSGEGSARSSQGGFVVCERVPVTATATLRGSGTAAGHCCFPGHGPWPSEPGSVFTPMAALISDSVFRYSRTSTSL